MPKYGYTKMFEKMLDNKNISVMLNTDYKNIINQLNYKRLIVT
jgi:UDP-galactopyranose mutase